MTKKLFCLLLAMAVLLSPAFASMQAEETSEKTEEEVETAAPVIDTEEPDVTEQPTETEETAEAAETEETTSPSAAPGDEINIAGSAVRLAIDNKNVYEGMERAYEDGYVPTVADGILTVILPLVADGAVKGDTITVTPQLGEASFSPVQIKNYQKSFALAANRVNETEDGEYDLSSSYLVHFDFPLTAERKNGTYSLALEIAVKGTDGSEYTQVFTCYYTITDGQNADSDNTADNAGNSVAEATPESKPKVIVSRYELNNSPVPAGEPFTATVTLKNTSETKNIQNMLVNVSCDSSNFVLQNPSNAIYIGSIKAGETAEIEISYITDLETPPQRYTITLTMEYDDSDAVTMTSQGNILVEVTQKPRIELSPFQLDESVNAGETFQMVFQAENLGRSNLYNVRVEVDVPGLSPVGSAFIGNLAAGTSGTATVNVFAGMVNAEVDDNRYGTTYGVVRLIYEDSGGTEYTEETEVSTTINALVIAAPDTTIEEQEQSHASMWWVVIAVGAIAAVLIAVFASHRKPSYAESGKHEKNR